MTLAVTDSRVDDRVEPMGVTAPRFSWRLTAGPDLVQSAYRIVVEGEGGGLAWDSGEVRSARTYGVPYEGRDLDPGTRYLWRVRVADGQGAWSDWSADSGFETAAEWSGDWIGAPGLPGSQRLPSLENVPVIWAAGPLGPAQADTGSFRTRFEVPGGARPLSARLVVGGVRDAEVFLNGCPVSGELVEGAFVAEAGDLVASGGNVLAIAARARDGRPGGLVARLEVVLEGRPALPQLVPVPGESAVTVTSGGRWRAAEGRRDGFERPGYDDAAWSLAEEVGLHGDPPWGREPLADRPSPYLRREFAVSSPVRRARLHATALGVYELRLNGHRVGEDHLAPGWTGYRDRLTFQTYDVTDLLAEGGNALGAVLADGWYAGNISWFGPFQYGMRLALRAELEIQHHDGTLTRIRTDGDWRAGTGAIRYADLQNGERHDPAAEPYGWAEPGFDDSAWLPVTQVTPPPGRLEPATAPPIRVQEELRPVELRQTGPGVWVADFGQNLVGWVRLTARGNPGRPVVIRHAEVLDHDGTPYLANLRSARAADEFVAGGEQESFEPRFTFHGFRYAEISGLDGPPAEVVARVAHAAMEPAGEFECSDERLNQLQRNIVWGQRGNFVAIPTDCPQRDERLGWTGDIWAFAPTALFNYDAGAFLTSWLDDVVDAQFEDGAVTHVAPDVLSGRDRAAGSPGWGDAIVLLPWALHRLRGDTSVAARCYEPMRRWLAYLEHRSISGIFPDEGFGDWLSLGADTPKPLVGTAIFALSARQLAELAGALGRTADEREFLELHAKVRQAFRNAFVQGPGVVASGTQTAYVLAIAAGLLEEHELPRAGARLVADIRARGGHLSTGFLGTPYLLDALTSTGHLETAYGLLLQDTFPSWLYPIVHGGATTMWERWDGWTDHRGLQDPGMNSFNHYAYGAVGDWMYRTVGGLSAGSPGYADIVVRPRPGGGITWARTAHQTRHGRVEVSWRQGGSLEVTVPPNARAEVWAGDRVHRVGSGSHTFPMDSA